MTSPAPTETSIPQCWQVRTRKFTRRTSLGAFSTLFCTVRLVGNDIWTFILRAVISLGVHPSRIIMRSMWRPRLQLSYCHGLGQVPGVVRIGVPLHRHLIREKL